MTESNHQIAPGEGVVPDSQYPWWVTSAPGWARPYILLARLDRPIGTWLLLLPCWWGAALGALDLGRDLPNIWHLVLFSIGAIIMRSAGCAFNDVVDRDIDARVARTRLRPIASGQLSRTQGFVFACLLSLAGLVVLIQFNTLTILVGVASVGLVAAYPFMKRVTSWPQAWLGLTFNYGALLGFTAATGALNLAAVFLYIGGVFWTLGYDTLYACQDVEDDAMVGIGSTARLFGRTVPIWVGAFYAAFILCLGIALGLTGASWLHILTLFLFGGAFFGWQIVHLLKEQDPAYLRLFRQNMLIGVLIFVIFCINALVNTSA